MREALQSFTECETAVVVLVRHVPQFRIRDESLTPWHAALRLSPPTPHRRRRFTRITSAQPHAKRQLGAASAAACSRKVKLSEREGSPRVGPLR